MEIIFLAVFLSLLYFTDYLFAIGMAMPFSIKLLTPHQKFGFLRVDYNRIETVIILQLMFLQELLLIEL